MDGDVIHYKLVSILELSAHFVFPIKLIHVIQFCAAFPNNSMSHPPGLNSPDLIHLSLIITPSAVPQYHRLRLYLKSHPTPSNSALFKGKDILSGVRNHIGCSRVHSFNPTMHRKNG